MFSNKAKVNLARETQEALESINIGISQVTRVDFYNSKDEQMQQCSYDVFDQIAQHIWYERCEPGDNCRRIQCDLRIYTETGYLERATEENGFDGWISCGPSFSLIERETPTGTLLTEYII